MDLCNNLEPRRATARADSKVRKIFSRIEHLADEVSSLQQKLEKPSLTCQAMWEACYHFYSLSLLTVCPLINKPAFYPFLSLPGCHALQTKICLAAARKRVLSPECSPVILETPCDWQR